MAIFWGWLSDGPLKGARWPFLYIGAAITIIFNILLLKMPLYTNIEGRKIVYWLSAIGVSPTEPIPHQTECILTRIERRRTTALVVDQRNLLRRHREARIPYCCRQRLCLCRAGRRTQLCVEDHRLPGREKGLHLVDCSAGSFE